MLIFVDCLFLLNLLTTYSCEVGDFVEFNEFVDSADFVEFVDFVDFC